jgi:hypothetical protein
MEDISDGLSRARNREEDYEVDGVSFGECHVDFGVTLEASDTRDVTSTWVDDNDWRCVKSYEFLQMVRATARDTEQRVVSRALERSGIEQHLVVEVQQWWKSASASS